MIEYTISVPLPIISVFKSKLRVLARRCVHVGTAAPIVTEGETSSMTIGGRDLAQSGGFDRPKVKVQVQEYTVQVEPPNLPGGWKVLGVVEHCDDLAGNLINSFHETVDLEGYRRSEMLCEHCNTRRARKKIVILRKDDGEQVAVGSTCLSKYISGISVAYAAAICDIYCWYERLLKDLDEGFDEDSWMDCAGPSKMGFETLQVLAATAEVISELGWLSVGAAGFDETPTRDIVIEFMGVWGRHPAEGPSEKSVQAAEDALRWIRAKDPALLVGYMGNLALVLDQDMLIQKRFGLAVSVFAAKQNEDKRAAEKQQKEQEEKQSPSQWVGDVKSRQTMTLTLDFLFDIHGVYGLTTLHKFHDDLGNVIVWFCTGMSDFTIGESYTVKATVKKHDVRDEIKQTVVNRVSEVAA